MLEQGPCQEYIILLISHLWIHRSFERGDANCHVMTGDRSLRHWQTALGMLLELSAQQARGRLICHASLQSVEAAT